MKRVEFADDLSALEEDHLALDFSAPGPSCATSSTPPTARSTSSSDDERAAAIESIRRGRSVRLPGWTEDLPPEIFVFERHPAHGVQDRGDAGGHRHRARHPPRRRADPRRLGARRHPPRADAAQGSRPRGQRPHPALARRSTTPSCATRSRPTSTRSRPRSLATDVDVRRRPHGASTREFKVAGRGTAAALRRA